MHQLFTERLLTCCRSREELDRLRVDLEAGDQAAAYRIQTNLVKETTCYRCTTCGKTYPFLSIHHMGGIIDPKSLSRPTGRLLKFKKASDVFRGDHYYATNKKTLLRFGIDADGNAHQTDEFPIMGSVFHVVVSADGRYIATESSGGTLAVIDAHSKETIARKRNCKLNGKFLFSHGERLLYYMDNAIRCWDFSDDREKVLWQAPEDWKSRGEDGKVYPVYCRSVLRLDRERMLFQLNGKQSCAVILRNLEPEGEYLIENAPVLCSLSYVPELEQYTLPTMERVIVYDSQFRMIDAFPYPDMRTYQDGDVFPITSFDNKQLHHAYLSPEGKWVLLDYFNYILLMERSTGELRYCVYSNTGGATRFMGFRDERHIWYNWGNSTYIMEIAP